MKKGLIFIFSSILLLGVVFSVKAFALSSSKILGVDNQNLIVRRVELTDNNKLVALTFDDGPAPITRDILKVLDEAQVLATFFVVGQNIDLHPEILLETYQKGHQIGNHTNTHPITLWMNQQDIAKEVLITEEKIYQQIRIRPKLLRAPYAFYPKNLLITTDLLDMLLISWDVDPQDWKQVNKQVITKRVTDNVTPGSIVLLHDGPPELDRSNTLQSLITIINTLKEDGYQFVTVSEMLEFYNQEELVN